MTTYPSEEECKDPDCPGCRMMRLLEWLKDDGWPPHVVIRMFFDYLQEVYVDDASIEMTLNEVEETLH